MQQHRHTETGEFTLHSVGNLVSLAVHCAVSILRSSYIFNPGDLVTAFLSEINFSNMDET